MLVPIFIADLMLHEVERRFTCFVDGAIARPHGEI